MLFYSRQKCQNIKIVYEMSVHALKKANNITVLEDNNIPSSLALLAEISKNGK